MHGQMKEGKFFPDHGQADVWKAAGKTMEGRVKVVIETELPPKTARQLGYYWGPVMEKLAEYYDKTRNTIFPTHRSVVHEEILKSFLGVDEDGKVKRSRKLNTKDYAVFTDETRAFLAKQGEDVPGPDEPWEDQYRDDPLVRQYLE